MSLAALILAGGSGTRFESNTPKQFHFIDNDLVINHSIKKFLKIKKITTIIITIDRKNYSKYKSFLPKNKKIIITKSGKTRALSVLNGLKKANKYKISKILIHDSARPFFRISLINSLLKQLKNYNAVVPAINSVDTIIFQKKIIPRNKLHLIQTPQAFDFKIIYNLHKQNKDININDDSTLFYKKNLEVKIIKGNNSNKKITYISDLNNNLFYGIGYDIHIMENKRKLVVGGIHIPSNFGPVGHSDGDSVIHALIDSLLGAMKKGDIGTFFPNINKYKNIRSTILLKKILNILYRNNFQIEGIDLNIILQKPNLKKYKNKIKVNLSKICKISRNKINIKAKTTDRLGLIGQNKALACEVITVVKKNVQ